MYDLGGLHSIQRILMKDTYDLLQYAVEPQFTYFSKYALRIYILIFLNELLYIGTQNFDIFTSLNVLEFDVRTI